MAAMFGKVQQTVDSRTYLAELMSEREKLSGHAARLVDQEYSVHSPFVRWAIRAQHGAVFDARRNQRASVSPRLSVAAESSAHC
ncbi:hypothetical protein MTO96_035236 [Rhipicephalus appendiculatus]